MSFPITTREIEYSAPDGERVMGYFAEPVTDNLFEVFFFAQKWWEIP